MDHLENWSAKLLELPEEDRVEAIYRLCWIDNPLARSLLSELERLLAYPRVIRMPALLIYGKPNSGKTRLIQRFRELHPPREADDDGQEAEVPVLVIESPPEPNERRLYSRLIGSFHKFRLRAQRVDEMEYMALTLLRNLRVKVLCIDEAQHMIAGSQLKKRLFLQSIKSLANQLQIVIVLVGTDDAPHAIDHDEQIKSRFQQIQLADWRPDENFKILINTFSRILPLYHPSMLTDPATLGFIHLKTEGRLGRVCNLMKRAAVWAIKTRKEYIDLDLLRQLPDAS